MPTTHTGTCAFCGSHVDPEYVACTGCGATWTGTVNLLGFALYAIAMPCGVLAAIVVGMQTNSLGMALAALAVVGLGVAGFSTSGLFRKWLWVRR